MELRGLVLHQRYRIYEQAGTSGMATVCLARDISTSDTVTALILEPPVTRDAGSVRRFLRSAELAFSGEHPYVAPIEDYGEEQDICFMVTQYGPQGATLAELERKSGKLPMVDSAWICSCVASALEGALAYGGILFHGALRPTGVIVTPSGDAKVSGFGTAPASGALDPILGEGAAVYAAPEQIDGRGVDIRTDLYALGAMLYEMLSQRVPSISEVRSLVTFEGSTHIDHFLADIPKQLRPALSGLLAWDPDERFASPGDVIEVLEKAGFPVPQRPLMESATGPGSEPGSMTDSVTAPHPELLAAPMVGIGELYLHEKTSRPLPSEQPAQPLEKVTSADVPPIDEGSSWETAVPAPDEPDMPHAIPLPAHRRRLVVPIIAGVLLVVAIFTYIVVAKPFKSGPGETVVTPPSDQMGMVSVTSMPPGASVVLDGSDRKVTTPSTLRDVAPGNHTILLRLTGYVDGQRNVTVTAGATSTLDMVLAKKPDTSKPPAGPSTPSTEPGNPPVQVETTLHVTSTPGSAAIVLDGKETGKLTPATIVITPGSHTVLLSLSGYAVATRTVNVVKGGQVSLSIPLTRASTVPLGSLRIMSTPSGAAVSIDGKIITGTTPLTVDIALGDHTVLVSLQGYEVYSQTNVEVVKGIQTIIAAQLSATTVDLSYTNKAAGFSFKYPGTWQIVQNQGSAEPVESTEVRSPAGPFVRITAVPLHDSTIQTYMAELRAGLENLPGLVITAAETRTVNGIVYQRLVALRAGSQTEYCLLQSGGSIYQLQCTAEVGLLNTASPGFRTILGSFFVVH